MSAALPPGYLERLRRLCAIDSPTGHREGLDACATLIAQWAGDAGCAVDLLPSPVGLHVVARTHGSGGRRTLLLGHHDTVYAAGTAAARPLRSEGERALGPGVADMKGGVLVGLAALERLVQSGTDAVVELHSVPDEEGRNVAPYTLASMHGADAALCLECGRPSGAIVTSRKAGCWVTITAHGVPAHAGTSPDEGRSALRALARELLRIEGELHGSRPGMTAVATQLHAGSVKNTVPDEAWGTIDVRALDDADLDYALGRIRSVGHHDGVVFAFSDDRGFPPMRRAPELADATLRALAAYGQPALEESAGGVSDGSWTSHIGVPTVDGLGPIGGDDHTEREWIELASVGPRVDAIVALCGS
ncbi:MAG: glutamate carboxypeptidase [Gaiellales bacterium]|nr:glutamate carboxypeptidase [Gaiellales bacterium]MDX6597536.1 glutamate carboxypeptidase [Gaiellales bacterium]